jgi:hypothetical protein
MSFLKQIFGGHTKANSSRIPSQMLSPATQQAAATTSTTGVRRELLKAVLRNTLNRHGIPLAWIGADMLVATAKGREPGIHWRLLVKHWDPRLMTYAVALQNALIVRTMSADPLASDWLMGISWQFVLPDEDVCLPMPHPGSWTAPPPAVASHDIADEMSGGSADVIAGPDRRDAGADSHLPATDPAADVRSDLERLFAVRDAELRQNAERLAAAGMAPTEPMYLKTEPLPFDWQPPPRSS